MSTVLEAIAARVEGAEVLGISLVTNLAAGVQAVPLNIPDMLAAATEAATRMGGFLGDLITRM
jgi:purine-nucleoside phosphorylase